MGLRHPKTIRPPLHFEFIIASNVRGKDGILQHFLFMRRGYWAGWENNMRDWTGQHHLWGAHHKRSALYWILWVVQLWRSYFVHPGARVNTGGVQGMAALIAFDLFNLPKIYHMIHLVRLVNGLYYTLLCFKLNLWIARWCIWTYALMSCSFTAETTLNMCRQTFIIPENVLIQHYLLVLRPTRLS